MMGVTRPVVEALEIGRSTRYLAKYREALFQVEDLHM
jgi:hypothetical protein